MRYLIVSDLHANLEALDAVLAESAGGYDRAICCGDLVGYGADPNLVCDWVRANCAVVVRGNHDRASTGQDDLEWFNPVARAAAVWTLQKLSRGKRRLHPGASPRPGDRRQLSRSSTARPTTRTSTSSPPARPARHSATWKPASPSSATPTCRAASSGTSRAWRPSCARRPRSDSQSMEIDPDCAYMINPGSVGQPRDGDPRAAYCIYDSDTHMVTYHRVVYDVAAAQQKIHDAGLPPILADRLAVGR